MKFTLIFKLLKIILSIKMLMHGMAHLIDPGDQVLKYASEYTTIIFIILIDKRW